MSKILFKNAKLRGQAELKDILVVDGIISKIENELKCIDENNNEIKVIDLNKNLTIPPYVEPHIHLDYVYTAHTPGATNSSGTLFEGIQRWSESKNNLNKDEVKERAKIALKKQITTGIQHIRTHVDVTDKKLTALKSMLELKEELKEIVDMQIIAFPQEGMYAYKGGDELVEEALKMGADVVGAIPHFEYTREFGEKSVKKAIELALKYDKLIDIHCDETDDEQSRFLEVLAAHSYIEGIGEKVTASHTCAMHSYNNAYTYKLFKLLKESKLNFIACPTENIHLQGRFDTYPKRRGITRVKEMVEAGLNVCFAQDSISDPWYPLGTGNLMNILDAGIHICQMMSFEEINNSLDLITINGAKTLNIEKNYGIKVGNKANFIVLNAKNEFEAIRERVGVLYSIRDGKVLFEKIPEVIKSTCGFIK
ncbi:cytosine deaminase [[Clostridium] sordellii]|uniref:cytosine deaminase n=1 Tax=Paraclostridium sordellii TaxID=1505 RepID=UPI0005E61265|nr:cytosine deaminase [Paeniclostridium sordellii]MDU4413879.1 cytosine deaminase [Paeniclostridium sordellii]MRZ28820.1 cytosine deaminase [Paeniclostridium sordellii]MVO75428.1 cytosine deaminase [Paeniclostridium sordellii]CEO34225.1 cytosine deaminase [[Clostridium] sordellii] [Paeniclostridium sordellii]CEP93642.1 cytosine deaminase [[Clostridium] sordellii] [Paeniclostridium sordellii]